MSQPRNILMFHAESWDGRMLGSMGHPALRTPNADALAERGCQFTDAYCSHPICCPSRANLWTGCYTHRLESWNNFKGLESGQWAFPEAVAQSHAVGYFGKRDYHSGGHTLLARLSAWLGPLNHDHPIMDEDPSQCFEVADDHNRRCHKRDWQSIDDACAFLQARSQSDDGRPFFCCVNSALVHAAFRTNRYWLEQIPEDLVDIPPEDPCDHPAIAYQRMAKAWRSGFDEDTVRLVRRIYCAMCAEADALLGALIDTLRACGLEDSTTIVFSSDHGELALEHQEWYKMSMYEGSVRVPMIVAGPNIPAGRRIADPVSLVDLGVSLCELADCHPPFIADGASLLPLARGERNHGRGSAYAMFGGCTTNTTRYMLRRGHWKLIHHQGYAPQLFNLATDPGELDDRSAHEPERLAELDAELATIVDRADCHQRWLAYNRQAFAGFRRQALQGLYVDATYGLGNAPSADYRAIMDNCFTGWSDADETRVERWLATGALDGTSMNLGPSNVHT